MNLNDDGSFDAYRAITTCRPDGWNYILRIYEQLEAGFPSARDEEVLPRAEPGARVTTARRRTWSDAQQPSGTWCPVDDLDGVFDTRTHRFTHLDLRGRRRAREARPLRSGAPRHHHRAGG